MKKKFKKIIAFAILFSLMLTITGCFLTEEEKMIIKQYEEEATEVMKDYLAENYSGAEILDVEQEVTYDTGNGFIIHEFTKFLVKYKTKHYTFYYDRHRKIVYSNVNYNKITKEIKNYIMENDNFNTEYLSSCYVKVSGLSVQEFPKEVILDSDRNFEDFINTINKDSKKYKIKVDFIYNNINNFLVKDFFAENSFMKFKYITIIVQNFTNDLNSDYMIMYIDPRNENKVFINYVHKKSIMDDDIEIIYDDRYINLQINKTDNYEQNPIIDYYQNIEFTSINLAYAWNAEIIKPFYQKKDEYITENGLKVEYSESENSELYMVLPEEKFENVYYESARENKFEIIDSRCSYDGKCTLSWNLNSESKINEDVISFYKEKID